MQKPEAQARCRGEVQPAPKLHRLTDLWARQPGRTPLTSVRRAWCPSDGTGAFWQPCASVSRCGRYRFQGIPLHRCSAFVRSLPTDRALPCSPMHSPFPSDVPLVQTFSVPWAPVHFRGARSTVALPALRSKRYSLRTRSTMCVASTCSCAR